MVADLARSGIALQLYLATMKAWLLLLCCGLALSLDFLQPLQQLTKLLSRESGPRSKLWQQQEQKPPNWNKLVNAQSRTTTHEKSPLPTRSVISQLQATQVEETRRNRPNLPDFVSRFAIEETTPDLAEKSQQVFVRLLGKRQVDAENSTNTTDPFPDLPFCRKGKETSGFSWSWTCSGVQCQLDFLDCFVNGTNTTARVPIAEFDWSDPRLSNGTCNVTHLRCGSKPQFYYKLLETGQHQV